MTKNTNRTSDQLKTTSDAVEKAEVRATELKNEILDHLEENNRLYVLSAAPGSGKSYLLLSVTSELVSRGNRVVISTNTNNQANNLVESWNKHPDRFGPQTDFYRVASKSAVRPEKIPASQWLGSLMSLPTGPVAVVSTTSKIAFDLTFSKEPLVTDYLIVEEAYQCTWSKFMQLSPLSSRILLIGDRGQIPPVVTVDVKRWETARFAPHWSAPEALTFTSDASGDQLGGRFKLNKLETSWRIPEESLAVVQPFYEDDGVVLDPVASIGERRLLFDKPEQASPISEAMSKASTGVPVLITIPSSADKVPERGDATLAEAVADLVRELFVRKTSSQEVLLYAPFESDTKPLRLNDLKILATKREMLAILEHALQPVWKEIVLQNPNARSDDLDEPNGGLFIDTPERAQGLDCKVTIVVHPLSGVRAPGEFDLETGRLSVMVSRHKCALFVVARSTVGVALQNNLPSATQAPSRPDIVGLGHRQHSNFWNWFEQNDQAVNLPLHTK
jgi:hypothetical protein